jgi:hypothetical protein
MAPGKYNPRASSVQVNPNQTKEKSLHVLGFLWPNRDFSMGYKQKNKKILPRLNSRAGL